MSDNEHVSPYHRLWWASSWKWTRSMLSFIAYSHPDIRFHPSAALVTFSLSALCVCRSSTRRAAHTSMSNHTTPEEERFDPLHILFDTQYTNRANSWHKFCLYWSERASKQGNKEGREDWALQSWQQASRWLPSPALR